MESEIVKKEVENLIKNGILISNSLELEWDNELAISRVDHISSSFNPDCVDTKKDGVVIWNNKGGFKRIEIRDEKFIHFVPEIHVDFMRSVISYRIPEQKIVDVRNLSESVQYDSLRGELSASCHTVGANVATLYLAIQIANGNKSVIEARRMYGTTIKSTLGDDGRKWFKFYSGKIGVEDISDGSIPGYIFEYT
uniref:Uncharacterized protein n=1 Tax=Pithovirus LCPAC104 TaxID=2506589 RepID=A0A481Z454_9VIRU|nr:MAG: uncharacterized protein LCPAC104_01700 [Pithovirus LCPAC104]